MTIPNETKADMAINLINTDFSKLYDVHIKAAEERIKIMRISLTFLSAPFVLLAALLSTKVIKPVDLAALSTIPGYIYVFVAVCGAANIIPYFRFIEATDTHMRTARAINNYRYLYSKILGQFYKDIDWTPKLPVDPNYPATYSFLSWAGVNVMFFVVSNSLYITLGLFGCDGNKPLSIAGFFVFLILGLLLYALYPLKGKIKKGFNNTPEDLLGFREVEL